MQPQRHDDVNADANALAVNTCIHLAGLDVHRVPEYVAALRARPPPILTLVSIENGANDVWRLLESCMAIDTVRFGCLSLPAVPDGYVSPRSPGIVVRSWIDESRCNSVVTYARTLLTLGIAGIVNISTIESLSGMRFLAGVHERTGDQLNMGSIAIDLDVAIKAVDVLLQVMPRVRFVTMVEASEWGMRCGGATAALVKAVLGVLRPHVTVTVLPYH